MSTVPPSESNIFQLKIVSRNREIERQSHDRRDPLARLEAELVLRSSALKMENDDLRERVETLERCLRLIIDNLQTAKELIQPIQPIQPTNK